MATAHLISSYLNNFLPRLDDILANPEETKITYANQDGVSKKSQVAN
jgi:hypothetical protein